MASSGAGPEPDPDQGPPGFEALREDLAGITGRATSERGYVTATIGSDGRLESAELGPYALRLTASELAAEVVGAVRAAQADFASQVEARVNDRGMGAGSAGVRSAEAAVESARRAQAQVQAEISRISGEFDRIRETFFRR